MRLAARAVPAIVAGLLASVASAGLGALTAESDAMTDEAFRMVDHLPRYQYGGVAQLQAHLRAFPPYAKATV